MTCFRMTCVWTSRVQSEYLPVQTLPAVAVSPTQQVNESEDEVSGELSFPWSVPITSFLLPACSHLLPSPPLRPDLNSCCQNLRVFCVTHHLNMVQTKVPCLSLLLVLELFCDTCTGGNTRRVRMTSLSSQPHCSPVGLSSQQADDNPTVC